VIKLKLGKQAARASKLGAKNIKFPLPPFMDGRDAMTLIQAAL
jgi:hypothetical protein